MTDQIDLPPVLGLQSRTHVEFALQYQNLNMEGATLASLLVVQGTLVATFQETMTMTFSSHITIFSGKSKKNAVHLLAYRLSAARLRTYHKRACMNVGSSFSSVVVRGHLLRKYRI